MGIRIINDIRLSHAIKYAMALWAAAMVLLYADSFMIDSMIYITITIAIFGFVLGLYAQLARIEQRLEDNLPGFIGRIASVERDVKSVREGVFYRVGRFYRLKSKDS